MRFSSISMGRMSKEASMSKVLGESGSGFAEAVLSGPRPQGYRLVGS